MTAVYLLLPVVLFAVGWLRAPFAALTLVLVAALLFDLSREAGRALHSGWQQFAARRLAGLARQAWQLPAAALLLAVLALSGAGGLGFQNPDYQASNALLKDLILNPWPLTFMADGRPARLVYYVGYYLPAALLGKWLGWLAANIAIWIWTAVGFGLAFAWFRLLSRAHLRRSASRLLWLALIFCLAGGLDFLALWAQQGAVPNLTVHMETWARYFQYSANTTLLYWVPQQALAAWLGAGLVMDALYHAPSPKYLAPALAAGLLWSPFGVVGLLPFVLLLPARYWTPAGRRRLWHPAALLAGLVALWVGGVVSLYLAANRFSFPIGWVWQGTVGPPRAAVALGTFIGVEFGALAVLSLLLLWLGSGSQLAASGHPVPRPADRSWFAGLGRAFNLRPRQLTAYLVSLAVLCLLPLLRVGIENDFVMRASIPALFVLWQVTAKLVVDAPQRWRGRPAQARFSALYLALVLVVLLGFLPGLDEVARSLRFYQFGPPPLSAVATTAEANDPAVVAQRAGNADAFFYRYLGQ